MFQDPAQVAALQAQVRVSQKQIVDQPPLGLSRSLSVSGTENQAMPIVKAEENPNFERDMDGAADSPTYPPGASGSVHSSQAMA